jgi:uncharacterized protein YoxC
MIKAIICVAVLVLVVYLICPLHKKWEHIDFDEVDDIIKKW